MKIFLISIFLGLVLQTSGQALEGVSQKIHLIKNPDKIKNDTTGFTKLPTLTIECDDHFKAYDFPKNKTKWDYYHVIDLNRDGRKDFIYSGPCLPYDQTSVFLNDGSHLKRVFGYAGRVVSIKHLEDRTMITLFKEACCCDENSDLVEVIVYRDSRVEEKWITFFGNTEVKADQVEKIKVCGILRTQPEVVDAEVKDVCTGELIRGNHLKNIAKATEVTQLSSQGNWRLVLFVEDAKQSWIGWIEGSK